MRAYNLKLLSSNCTGCPVVEVSGTLDPESDAEDVKGTGEWTGTWLLCYVNCFYSAGEKSSVGKSERTGPLMRWSVDRESDDIGFTVPAMDSVKELYPNNIFNK